MTPKNKLFLGILVLSLIVNLLIIFNLNYFYIRAILAFVFIITIPGLLIMLCLKIRNINFWEYLVYTVGLSVSFIMFAGLAVNWILPFLNITDKPLSLYPILICFDTILLILWLIAHKRNEDNTHILIFPFEEYKIKGPKSILSKIIKDKIHNSKKLINKGQSSKNQQKGISNPLDENSSSKSARQLTLLKRLKFIPQFPSLSWLDRIFMIIPFCFPFMAVIGAFLLNNHGTNIVTMIMLGAIAVYVFLVVIFRDKLNENVFPWALWMIGLSIILSFWLRSSYIVGVDVNKEYWVSSLTIDKSIWSIANYRNAYNTMLSLSILPTAIRIFSNLNLHYIYKLYFQLIYSIIPLVMFLFFKRYKINDYICFLGSFFFLSSVYLIAIQGRQIIALLFFSLMLLVLFSKKINPKIRNLLFVIFGFSMIVSHYSTSYIALALFLFTYILTFFYKKWENRKIKKGKLKPSEKQEFYLTGIIILLLLIFGFLWYGQITEISSGPIDFIKNSISNIQNIFKEDTQTEGNMIFDNIFVFKKSVNLGNTFEKYKKDVNDRYLISENESQENKNYNAYLKFPSDFPPIINQQIYKIPLYTRKYLEFAFRFFIFIGVFFLFFNRKKLKVELFFLNLMSFLILILFSLLPYFSYYYDLPRFYQHILILLSINAIIGLEAISLIVFRKKVVFIIILLSLIEIYFLSNSGFLYGISGGGGTPLRLSNNGWEANTNFIHDSEIISAFWFINNKDKNPTYLDTYSNHCVIIAGMIGRNERNVYDLFPQIMKRDYYVYSSYINTQKELSIKIFSRVVFSFNFPTEFLNDNKNKIYNNGGSEIFK